MLSKEEAIMCKVIIEFSWSEFSDKRIIENDIYNITIVPHGVRKSGHRPDSICVKLEGDCSIKLSEVQIAQLRELIYSYTINTLRGGASNNLYIQDEVQELIKDV